MNTYADNLTIHGLNFEHLRRDDGNKIMSSHEEMIGVFVVI